MVEKGIALGVIQAMVGHISARMLRHYTHVTSGAARRASVSSAACCCADGTCCGHLRPGVLRARAPPPKSGGPLRPTGERALAAEDFSRGAYLTALEDTDILTGIEIPRRPETERWGYAKVAVKVGDYAESLSMALADSTKGSARLVLGAVDGAPLVLDATARAALEGADRTRLAALAREEIAAANRPFSGAKLTMHTTTALRALEAALTK